MHIKAFLQGLEIIVLLIILTVPRFASARQKTQYEQVSIVLLSSGTNLMESSHRSAKPEILEDGNYLETFKASEEVNSIYESISTLGAPTLLFASNSIPSHLDPYMKNKKTEYSLAQERFSKLVSTNRMSILSFPQEILETQYPRFEDQVFPDRWVRDWGPSNVGSVLYYRSDLQRGTLANPEISNLLKMDLKDSSYFPVGGTFMNTTDGVCALSATSDESKIPILGKDTANINQLVDERLVFLRNVFGCKKILPLEPLPLEPLGHLDLFVKFLSDKKVAVARYQSDLVQVRAVRKIQSTDCFPPSELGPCDQTYNRKYFSGSISDIERKDLEFKDVVQYISAIYPNASIEFAELWNDLGANKPINLKQFSDNLVVKLKAAGFEVVEIPQPQPVVTLSLQQHQGRGNVYVVDKVRARIMFPTYLNSILVNGTAFIPSYKYWGNEMGNLTAVNLYQASGFRVVPLPSDFVILEGGTIHCITKEIH